jgi:hypothetical protein
MKKQFLITAFGILATTLIYSNISEQASAQTSHREYLDYVNGLIQQVMPSPPKLRQLELACRAGDAYACRRSLQWNQNTGKVINRLMPYTKKSQSWFDSFRLGGGS